ncbi:hypothetical protein [Bacillus fonticola]|uniref:hypothetical protein n=1 Tax=Bacillus fonticola TaxID=2728853 RepID=UPI001472E424|nr:hypothetical protein [Bacillus fonticola]
MNRVVPVPLLFEVKEVEIAFIIVILIMVAGLIGTLALGGKGDENYRSETKGNVTRLTLMYVALVVILAVGLGLYIYW